MVLAELGSSITEAISKATNFDSNQDLDQQVVTTLTNDISKALLKSDVSFSLVAKIKKGIENAMNSDKLSKSMFQKIFS